MSLARKTAESPGWFSVLWRLLFGIGSNRRILRHDERSSNCRQSCPQKECSHSKDASKTQLLTTQRRTRGTLFRPQVKMDMHDNVSSPSRAKHTGGDKTPRGYKHRRRNTYKMRQMGVLWLTAKASTVPTCGKFMAYSCRKWLGVQFNQHMHTTKQEGVEPGLGSE